MIIFSKIRLYKKPGFNKLLSPWFFCFILTANFAFSQGSAVEAEVVNELRTHILTEAGWAMTQDPITVTAETSPRSAGGKHDFYSEGDYWWPDTLNPAAPYIQRDGLTNPDNFTAHRRAMIRFSRIVGALTSAYKITGEEKYVTWAFRHINAWFLDPETKMNPSLLYAQAIKGRATGRGIGIIDTIHLMEVAQGIILMQQAKSVNQQQVAEVKDWFAQYINWLRNHPYGKDEMEAKNNHGTCWAMQVASFAKLTGNKEVLDFCRNRYKTVFLPYQMHANGSFPQELRRTKPYGYSIFNLDAMVMLCQILSDKEHNLWLYETIDGRNIRKGIRYLYPYIADKSKWPLKPDVMYWENWPVAQPFLVFGAQAFNEDDWLETWKKLDHNPKVEEVLRNLPIRNPVIWFE
ncbi:alginate lyase family protein [Dyadobacter sp. LHD-138]|uniref:alginate lyase family protein n=1 Tax=Dyadobacter sp. LHD-138 TaxID=3071413 RepID=UPI0027DED021|nr:alginate lyase family protein [Dyadobacter sp. LHD-138]MDQ6480906.1 alginate lyase family protein [Dyadobacter sp. LHD-138]